MAKKVSAFNDMTTEALLCRSLGHAWTITLISRKRYDGGVWEVALECLRCTTTRDDVVPAGADPKTPFNLARTYGYADAYVVADLKSFGGASLLKRNARDVLFRRLRKNGT